ncbi:MAG: hypothetical protein NW226_19470 [Microscillaceae bacterium]|nr:hypothetical protein [Microscillaceae bacterium]
MKLKLYFIILITVITVSESTFGQYVPKEKRNGQAKKDSTSTQKNPNPTTSTPTTQKSEKEKKSRVKPSELAEQSFWQRLTLGGNTGFSFGNPTVIDLSPLLGYRFTERFVAGFGGNYLYYKGNDIVGLVNGILVNLGNIKGSYYGARSYGQYFVVPQAFIWAELEGMNVEYFNENQGRIDRQWQLAPLVGGGFFQSIGNSRSGFSATILYNINHQSGISWRGTPWVTRVGFNF